MKVDYFKTFPYARSINSYKGWGFVGIYLESGVVYHIFNYASRRFDL